MCQGRLVQLRGIRAEELGSTSLDFFSQTLQKGEAHPESLGCEASLQKKPPHPLGVFDWPENCGTPQ